MFKKTTPEKPIFIDQKNTKKKKKKKNTNSKKIKEKHQVSPQIEPIAVDTFSTEDFFAIHDEEKKLNEDNLLKKVEKKEKLTGFFSKKRNDQNEPKEKKSKDEKLEYYLNKVKNFHPKALVAKAKQMNKKHKYILLSICFFFIFTIIYLFSFGNIKYYGYAEATVYPQVSEVSGKILEYPVNVGQVVNAGDIVAIIDSEEEQFTLEQLKLSLDKLKIALADSKSGSVTDANKQNMISLAEAKYNSAVDVANMAAKDYNDALELYNGGSLTESDLSSYRLSSELAFKDVEVAKAELNSTKTSNTAATIEVEISLVENQIEQLENILKKFQITASCNGTIVNKKLAIGDVISKGKNLVDIATEDEMYLNFIIPKSVAKKISYNQEVNYQYDSKVYTGNVLYIDVKNQFSKESKSSKNKDQVNIKVTINTDVPIKPGEKVHLLAI